MLTILCFDVEDYVTPAEEDLDGITMALAELLRLQELSGSFFVLGEYLRVLQARGRLDVIRALARHDIGLHTRSGSMHPNLAERLEQASWAEGCETVTTQEMSGFAPLEEAFVKQVRTYAMHGGVFAPQLVAALGKSKKAFVYSPVSLPGRNIVWYCGTLNLGGGRGLTCPEDVYLDNARFAEFARKLTHDAETASANVDFLPTMVCRPSELRAIEPWDRIFRGGRNPRGAAEWIPPPLRPRDTLKTSFANVRKMLQLWSKLPFLEISTASGLYYRYHRQQDDIDVEDIREVVSIVSAAGKPTPTEYFSAAECLDMLARAVLGRHQLEVIPNQLTRREVLGPIEPVPSYPQGNTTLSRDGLVALARDCERACARGLLPGRFTVGNSTFGLGTALLVLAEALQGPLKGKSLPDSIKLSPAADVPDAGETIKQRVLELAQWHCHRPGLDMSHIAELARLQSWTLKPAIDWTSEKYTERLADTSKRKLHRTSSSRLKKIT